jgi:type II secretory pathway pseudopilin PulG
MGRRMSHEQLHTLLSMERVMTGKLWVRTGRHEGGVSVVELVVVLAASLILTAVSIPSFLSSRRNYRALGDARSVAAEILLAKMRASSDFTQARARFDTSANTFQLEIWDKTGTSATCVAAGGTPCWTIDAPSGTTSLSPGDTLGYGPQTNAPPGTQTTLGQSEACYAGASGAAPGTTIANTACVTFNSRGIPIDHTGAATSNDAIYLTDGVAVYATTISATGLPNSWRIDAHDATQADWNMR